MLNARVQTMTGPCAIHARVSREWSESPPARAQTAHLMESLVNASNAPCFANHRILIRVRDAVTLRSQTKPSIPPP